MADEFKDQPRPLTKIRNGRAAGVPTSPRTPNLSEKSLVSVDAMSTGSMRRDGLLPPVSMPAVDPLQAQPDIADYNPMSMHAWTFMMALAWVATKRLEPVIWQRSDWRRKLGWRVANIPTTISPDENDPHPASFLVLPALQHLGSKAETGDIEVRAMSVTHNRPIVLTSLDWSYGKFRFPGRDFEDIFAVGEETYVRLTIEREKLMTAFPSEDLGAPRYTAIPQQVKGRPSKYAWAAFHEKCAELWEYHGGFSDVDVTFSRPSHLINQMLGWCQVQADAGTDGWPRVPAESAVKSQVTKFLATVSQ